MPSKKATKKPAKKTRRAPDGHQTPTVPWHKPLCSGCGDPIEEPSHGLAGWFIDDDDVARDPFIAHTGRFCDFYRNLRAHRPRRLLKDHHIDWFRRTPLNILDAVLEARPSSSDERVVWKCWVSAVLGIPVLEGEWNDLTMNMVTGAVATRAWDRVPTLDEVRRGRGDD